MAELQIRVPYKAWGDGDAWQGHDDEIHGDLYQAVEAAGIGSTDDPDHWEDYICFYLIGDDVEILLTTAREVLRRRGVLTHASAMVTDPDANDLRVGTPMPL